MLSLHQGFIQSKNGNNNLLPAAWGRTVRHLNIYIFKYISLIGHIETPFSKCLQGNILQNATQLSTDSTKKPYFKAFSTETRYLSTLFYIVLFLSTLGDLGAK